MCRCVSNRKYNCCERCSNSFHANDNNDVFLTNKICYLWTISEQRQLCLGTHRLLHWLIPATLVHSWQPCGPLANCLFFHKSHFATLAYRQARSFTQKAKSTTRCTRLDAPYTRGSLFKTQLLDHSAFLLFIAFIVIMLHGAVEPCKGRSDDDDLSHCTTLDVIKVLQVGRKSDHFKSV